MANHHRGEIIADLGGERMTLCLTLGALAELEAVYGEADLLALAERFEGGRISAIDAIRVIAAGARGAGRDISDAEIGALKVQGGAAGYVEIVSRLLAATFAPPGS